MTGAILDLIKIGCERHPQDDAKAVAFIRQLMGLYAWLDDLAEGRQVIGPTQDGVRPALVVRDGLISGEVAKTSPVSEPAPAPAPAPSEDNAAPPEPQSEDYAAADDQETQAGAAPPNTDRVLGKTQDKVWRYIAQRVSDTALSPGIREIAQTLKMTEVSAAGAIRSLTTRGYFRIEGKQRGRLIHVNHWPHGIKPRETKGRINSADRSGKPLRRFETHHDFDPTNVRSLSPQHPALVEKRTLFPNTVVRADDAPRVLVSGENQRKLGDRVTKGAWSGMPIYSLTLEERATCPETCHHWANCYGNGMPRARRHKHGPELIQRLGEELEDLQADHPDGFVVRLHLLGDFYETDYVTQWGKWLIQFPALHVFGYTARDPWTPMGALIQQMSDVMWDRFAIRLSAQEPGPGRAVTIQRRERGRIDDGMVCPAQTEEGVACGSCGLCWAENMKNDTIIFMEHGPRAKAGEEKVALPPPAQKPTVTPTGKVITVSATPTKAKTPARPLVKSKREQDREEIERAVAAGKPVTKLDASGMVEENDDIDRLANFMRQAGYSFHCNPHAPAGRAFVLDGKRHFTLDDLFNLRDFRARTCPVSKQQVKTALIVRRMGGRMP